MQESEEISPRYCSFRLGGTLIVLEASEGRRARIVYAGPHLGKVEPAELDALSKRHHAPGGPEKPIAAPLLNSIGTGHPSPPGLLAHIDGRQWALDPKVSSVDTHSGRSATIATLDLPSGLKLTHAFHLSEGGVLSVRTSISNETESELSIDWCAALCVPLPSELSRVTSFSGRWSGEFQTEEHDLARGSFLRENRSGRTSHDCYPGLYLGTPTTSEDHGSACAVHLGWSGNHRLRVDKLADGSISLQAGELLLPGEITLAPGEEYTTPTLDICWSNEGYGDVTRRLHDLVRSRSPKPEIPRPVHFNTWEAVYFDHDPQKLMALADQAAAVGAERFVLDDGWFGGRRSDRAGLGDWYVSEDVYPEGLKPLADHVRGLGMEFGLWFEPEMVNPDSDLYRAHPEWVLQVEGVEPIASRHQLAINLSRPEVAEYLFERIDTLVCDLGIAYIKWDMNRDIQLPGGEDGQAVMHHQTRALYALIDRIRLAHPDLVIESCSSGGARADFGILERTDRVWTSDNNDARARHSIMRGAAYFLPLEILGNHVGPERCHITGRRFDMAFRAGTAVLGHMGMELNLADESEGDRAVLASAIGLYKRHRGLIQSGNHHRLETPDHISATGVVSADNLKALYQIAILDQHPGTHPPRVRFAGLAADNRYKLVCIWPEPLAKTHGSYSGAALMRHGLQLPLTYPDTCLIYHLEAET